MRFIVCYRRVMKFPGCPLHQSIDFCERAEKEIRAWERAAPSALSYRPSCHRRCRMPSIHKKFASETVQQYQAELVIPFLYNALGEFVRERGDFSSDIFSIRMIAISRRSGPSVRQAVRARLRIRSWMLGVPTGLCRRPSKCYRAIARERAFRRNAAVNADDPA